MAIKTYRPITPTLRFQTSLVNDDITTNEPHKALVVTRKRTGGRRNSGDLTCVIMAADIRNSCA